MMIYGESFYERIKVYPRCKEANMQIPYFFDYKTELISSKTITNYKSYKTDLDRWDCLGRVKLVL